MRACATTLEPEMLPGESTFLKETLRRRAFQGKHLEVGTAAGGTLCDILSQIHPNNSHPVVVVDPMTYFPRQMDIVRENLARHGHDIERVEFRKTTSRKAFAKASSAGERFDFILIDACHKFPYVVQDLRWSRLLNVGGLLAMHDVCPKHWDVQLAAKLFLRRHQAYRIFGQKASLLLIEKIEEGNGKEIYKRNMALANLAGPLFQLRRSFLKRIR